VVVFKMSTIKAVVNIGGGQAEIKDVPLPELPGPDYMLVKTVAWAINPDEIDKLELPDDETCAGTVMGADFAGYVLEVGSEVKRFKEGDRVAGMVLGQSVLPRRKNIRCRIKLIVSRNIIRQNDGSFADVIAAKAEAQMKIPDGLDYAEAATQGVAVATMVYALAIDQFQLS
jgi:NADPH:quinone reductase-like Zn-dependent oxidoreductase